VSAGAAPSLEDHIKSLEQAQSFRQTTLYYPEVKVILAYLRELAALRAPVADGDVADAVDKLHSVVEWMGLAGVSGIHHVEAAIALLERLALERDERKACRFKDVALANRRIAALEAAIRDKWLKYSTDMEGANGDDFIKSEWAAGAFYQLMKEQGIGPHAGPEPRE
jgi:hypothetical protein